MRSFEFLLFAIFKKNEMDGTYKHVWRGGGGLKIDTFRQKSQRKQTTWEILA